MSKSAKLELGHETHLSKVTWQSVSLMACMKAKANDAILYAVLMSNRVEPGRNTYEHRLVLADVTLV